MEYVYDKVRVWDLVIVLFFPHINHFITFQAKPQICNLNLEENIMVKTTETSRPSISHSNVSFDLTDQMKCIHMFSQRHENELKIYIISDSLKDF